MKTLILSTILKALTPLFIGFAVYMFFRGHDNPGGGFIAGLIASIPLMIHSMVFGFKNTREKFRINPRLLTGLGLFLALLSGFFSVSMGDPFMTSIWVDEKLPLIGKIGTPIFFDMGVFLVVFGVVLQITFLLTEE
jgi:multicomponent Na+:H+ antiporter subunit B